MADFDAEAATIPAATEPNESAVMTPVVSGEKATPFAENTAKPVTITDKHQLIRR